MNLEKANAAINLGDVLLNNMTKEVQLLKAQRDELLDALCTVVKMAEAGMVDFNPHDQYVMDAAQKAIAKAKGESDG